MTRFTLKTGNCLFPSEFHPIDLHFHFKTPFAPSACNPLTPNCCIPFSLEIVQNRLNVLRFAATGWPRQAQTMERSHSLAECARLENA